MTDRERLIELLKVCLNYETIETDDGFVGFDVRYEIIADYLLVNGVIVPPCKVGDTVWELLPERCKHRDNDICDNYCDGFDVDCSKYKAGKWIYETKFRYSMLDLINKTVFLTREEAERALKERESNG